MMMILMIMAFHASGFSFSNKGKFLKSHLMHKCCFHSLPTSHWLKAYFQESTCPLQVSRYGSAQEDDGSNLKHNYSIPDHLAARSRQRAELWPCVTTGGLWHRWFSQGEPHKDNVQDQGIRTILARAGTSNLMQPTCASIPLHTNRWKQECHRQNQIHAQHLEMS